MSLWPRATASSSSWRVTSSQRQTKIFAMVSVARVLAPRIARFEDGDLRERRELGLHPVPDPFREDLARRVLEPRKIVQIVMVELQPERLPDVVDDPEIDEPPRIG